MVPGILWQLVDFGSASNELYPPVASKITNIFKMFSALGKGSQLTLVLWAAPFGAEYSTSLPGKVKWESGEKSPTTERPERSMIQGAKPGPNMA